MSTPETGHERGEVFCRPSDWIDIVKFFLLNYGLHGLTVMTMPGSTWLPKLVTSVVSICMPSFGIVNAFQVLLRLAIIGRTDLETALRAGALCMVVPSLVESDTDGETMDENPFRPSPADAYNYVAPEMIQVHGQHPASATRRSTRSKQSTDPEKSSAQQRGYSLIVVPSWFTIEPLLDTGVPIEDSRRKAMKAKLERIFKKIKRMFIKEKNKVHGDDTPTIPNISCNYSAIKTLAALLQILYGSFELYRARGDQLETYGYAAYSLTVIPYLLMSIANLFASLSGPQYPSMFIVYYRGLACGTKEEHTADNKTEADQGDDKETRSTPDTLKDSGFQIGSTEVISSIETTVPKTVAVEVKSNEQAEDGYPTGWWTKEEREDAEKMISGAVGCVYGDLYDPEPPRGRYYGFYLIFLYLFSTCLQAAPYAIIGILTNFKKRQSTLSQRSWVMCWIVLGQLGVSIASIVTQNGAMRRRTLHNPMKAYLIQSLALVLLSVATIGGFVVVAQMIAADQICNRL